MKTRKFYITTTRVICLLALCFFLTANNSAAQQLLYPDLISWAKPGRYMYDVQIDRSQGKLLRFSVAIANKGAGTFELHGTIASDGTTSATQWIYDDQGGHTERYAGSYVFSDDVGHNHFHFANFANYRLLAVVGKNGIGSVVAKSDKIGFAMFDDDAYNLSLPGAPQSAAYTFPQGTSLNPEGISVGWADVYDRSLGNQWINIAGVPNGQYWLEVTVDPFGQLAESDRTNNTTYVKVILKGNHVKTNNDQPSAAAIASASASARMASMPAETVSTPTPTTETQIITSYPNPSRGEFNVRLEDNNTGSYHLRISDFSGNPLAEQDIVKDGQVAETHFDLKSVREGIYLLSIYHDGKTTTSKIFVTR